MNLTPIKVRENVSENMRGIRFQQTPMGMVGEQVKTEKGREKIQIVWLYIYIYRLFKSKDKTHKYLKEQWGSNNNNNISEEMKGVSR